MKTKLSLVVMPVAILMIITSSACTRISPGHVGIVVNQWGSEKGVSDYAVKTGTITYNPITTSVYSYPTYMQTVSWVKSPHEGNPIDESITFTIKGNMAINVDVNLSYDLNETRVPHFYVQFRSDDLDTFTHGFMRNVTRDSFNNLGGSFDLDQVMGDNAAFVAAVREDLQNRVATYGVNIKQFGIVGAPRPPEQVQAAINAKIGATQLAIQKQNELLQAEADAKKTVATADGQAKSILAVAKAQAEANRILSESITGNLLQYRAYEKWNGQLPQITGGGTIPMVTLPTKQ